MSEFLRYRRVDLRLSGDMLDPTKLSAGRKVFIVFPTFGSVSARISIVRWLNPYQVKIRSHI